jgi:hypothetical protein
MTFADALNENNVQAGVEEGQLFLVDDNDNVTKVGDFCVLQTNAGPDLRLGDDGRLSVCAVREGDCDPFLEKWEAVHWATFDGHRWA